MRLRQADTPLLAAMQHYVQEEVIPFHTPGHKQGKGMHHTLERIIGRGTLALDLALMEELDDFHEPYGCIKDAQELAAQLYGADHSFFVINGTTGGIYAMILAVAGPGEKIIVPRNAHRSIIGGIILSGAIPIFMQPEVDNDLGLAMGVTPETVENTVRQHPDAKGVLIINPNYYGVAVDLKKIVNLVHEHNMVVLVDEAHGPHLRFSNRLPIQALDAGADICAQSTHKIIGALTQCSLVHCREGRIRVPHLKAMLQLTQSTSPNYIMLVSLDVARMQMALEGTKLIERSIALANWTRQEINKIPGLYCFGSEKKGNPGIYDLDPTKVTVTVKGLGLTGPEAERILRHQYKIQVELSDLYNLLFLITLGDREEEVHLLVAALRDMAEKYAKAYDFSLLERCIHAPYPVAPQGILSPREALFGNTCMVPFAHSAGMICAEIVTFYPPGIPVVCPGERITQEIIDYCQLLQQSGMHVSGPEDYTLKTIKVVD
ncbi:MULTISPECIES: aminotransferase class I/II-fold pyridoxal phosphate-dependent enzyme [Pelosinus]|uniref:Orn/Lys/Arg decarboxylase major region n=1 Tax=Pelosinus fermentans B4 TaxID=1149862 RepID=I8RAE8_9FIRM|nr:MULTISPECIES: aminotransferase class I/II-fold pyridoxal phosphate-dependent enzyme [Pelosinus]EIW15858.1 Orn/Lys/Arg decarboxylase major region [Pelosinus fermentans B4]EIW27436.1 Orn/Lys/Arg decarboxylase major region [Pelosinus fermentans A11]OAM92607.1 Arginine decarboxylase [Pelosinus fermentans DSM 17108]SDQ50676.1 arginine decarboxylase [Pelosinus fermentans]